MPARFSLRHLLLAALFALHAGAMARTPHDPPPAATYLPQLKAAEQAAAVLPPDAWNRERTPETKASVLRFNREVQALGTERAFAGDPEGAIAAFDLLNGQARPLPAAEVARDPMIADAHAEEAIKAIVEQARSRQVVILNEAHHVPMHRAFARRLAAALRKIGYDTLACETFSSATGDMRDFAPGQAIDTTGYFAREPSYANFVNAALADGWKLVAYEKAGPPTPGASTAQRIMEREQAQARNLAERIFAKDRNAKVLIYVGYAHVYKSRPGDTANHVWMAEYLHRMLPDLRILHVDQTSFYAHPDRSYEGPFYAGLLDKFPLKEPFVLRAPDGGFRVLEDKQGLVDMQVIFPRYAMRDGRPEWLQTLAESSPREIPAALLPKQGRRIVKAYRTTDRPDAIPADVVLVEAGKPVPKLMLPTGEFRFELEE